MSRSPCALPCLTWQRRSSLWVTINQRAAMSLLAPPADRGRGPHLRDPARRSARRRAEGSVVDQRRGHRHALLLASRQARLACGSRVSQDPAREQAMRALDRVGSSASRPASATFSKRCQMAPEVVAWKTTPTRRGERAEELLRPGPRAARCDLDRARARLVEPGSNVHQSRLAAADGPTSATNSPGLDPQRRSSQGDVSTGPEAKNPEHVWSWSAESALPVHLKLLAMRRYASALSMPTCARGREPRPCLKRRFVAVDRQLRPGLPVHGSAAPAISYVILIAVPRAGHLCAAR